MNQVLVITKIIKLYASKTEASKSNQDDTIYQMTLKLELTNKVQVCGKM